MAYSLDQHTSSINRVTLEKRGYLLTALQSVAMLDLRALALMRIGAGIVLIADLLVRASDLVAHYTNQGVLPLEALFRYAWNQYYFSVYTTSSNWQWQVALFLLNIACAACLLVGYRTRLFTFLCWLFILSLHNRNPLIQQGGDDLLRLILFWGMFLPWGFRYSMDSLQFKPSSPVSNNYLSLAGFAFVCQIFYIYFFTALLKSSPEWTSEYTALYYALSLDHIVTPFGKWLYQFGGLLKLLTAVSYYTELVIPFLLFIPFYNRYFRLAFIILIFSFHMGINLSLYVGLFPWISTVSLVGIIPNLADDYGRVSKKIWVYIENYRSRWQSLQVRFLSRRVPVKIVYAPKESILTTAVILFFLIYTFTWNLGSIGKSVYGYSSLHWVAHLLRIDQYWGMFAPAVFKDDGWFILAGKTKDAQEIDIKKNGGEVSYQKPEVIADFFKNDRWRKYHENILFVRNSHYRLYYCSYLLNKWNEQQGPEKKLARLSIIYMKEVNLPDYKESVPKREVLCECWINP